MLQLGLLCMLESHHKPQLQKFVHVELLLIPNARIVVYYFIQVAKVFHFYSLYLLVNV